jgi:acyl carrier protein
MKSRILQALSEILETDATEATVLGESVPWDSMTVLATIMEIDEICGVRVKGEDLASKCHTVGDILKLAGIDQ